MKTVEMKVTKAGNDQLFIPLSKKLEHSFKAGDKVTVQVVCDKLVVSKK